MRRSVTSTYAKKRLWLLCLSKITRSVINDENGDDLWNTRNQERSDNLYHSFSSPKFLYFSASSIQGLHFVADQIIPQPSAEVHASPVSDTKLCSNCAARLLFSKSVQCSRCGRVFCRNCCNERALSLSE